MGTKKIVWRDHWNVPISLAGVAIAITAVAVTSCQQATANRLQSEAIRLQTKVVAISLADQVRQQLVEGARRFEAARSSDNEDSVKFEMNFLLSTIEVYFSYSKDLQGLDVELPDSGVGLAVGILRVLATGFCNGSDSNSAGKHFTGLGFPKAGALAAEYNVKACP